MKRSMTGVLTLVQEERFQLADAARNQRFFTLAHDAPLEAAQLVALRREGARITVHYDDAPDALVHVAHRVVRAAGE